MKAILLFLLLSTPLLAIDTTAPLPDANENGRILVHNRIITKIGTKPITMMDVVHKMDLYFYRQYPHLASSDAMRYKFYMTTWKEILASLIDEQLILSDAAEKEVTVNDGEVREEIEKLFGPNVLINLEKINLPRAEAETLVRNEQLVRKMIGMLVRSKANADVHPKKIRQSYEEFLKKNPAEDVWKYRMITLRGGEEAVRQALAEKLAVEIKNEILKLDSISRLPTEGVLVKVSEEYVRKEKEISLAHKGILQAMETGKEIASGIQHEPALSRFFYLVSHEAGKAPLFTAMEDQLKKALLDDAVKIRMEQYMSSLRERYGINKDALSFSENFEPFVLL